MVELGEAGGGRVRVRVDQAGQDGFAREVDDGCVWPAGLEDLIVAADPKDSIAFNNRGNAWRYKKEFDKAIKDYDEAIRLDPSFASAYFGRAVALMIDRRPKAAAAFQKVIDVEAGTTDLSAFAVILGHLAARQAGDDTAAKRFLNESAQKLKSDWPFPIVRYLRGDLSEAELLKLAVDDDKRTGARCYLGMDLALKGKKDAAIAHFRWVKEHGNQEFTEYAIALAELERLEKAGK